MILGMTRIKGANSHPRYLSHFNIGKAPFSTLPDTEFFYADPLRSQYLDMLQHFTQYSDELLLVTGEAGSGKTSLLEQYLGRTEEHWRICRLDGRENIEPGELFIHLAHCFDLDVVDLSPEQLLDALRGQLISLRQRLLPVLIIDDADLLSEDALEIVIHLASMEDEDGRLLRTILFSDPDIVQQLDSERFHGLAEPHQLDLGRLDEGEITEYLQHRLKVAGYAGDLPFDARQQRRICKLSGGLPVVINRLANEILQQQMESGRPAALLGGSGSGYKTWFKVGAAGLALAITVLTLYERLDTLGKGDEPAQQSSNRLTGGVSAEATLPIVRAASRPNGNQMEMVIRDGQSDPINRSAPVAQAAPPAVAQQSLQPMLKEVPLTAGSAAPARPVAETGVVESDVVEALQKDENEAITTPVKPVLESISPDHLVASDSSQTLFLQGRGFVGGLRLAVSFGNRARVMESDQVKVLDGNRIEFKLATGNSPGSWAVQVNTPSGKRSNVLRFEVTAPKEEKSELPVPVPLEEALASLASEQPKTDDQLASPTEGSALVVPSQPLAVDTAAKSENLREIEKSRAGGIEGEQWLRQQPAEHYTLQLIAASKRSAVEQFARRKKLGAPLAILSTVKDGAANYALLQGSYASHEAAVAAANALPADIKPWIRSFGSVHAVPSGGGIRDEGWLWSQDPAAYMLQLAGSGSEQVLKRMFKGRRLSVGLAIIPTSREGKPWFLLLAGPYPDYAAARGAIALLPPSLQAAGPWPRTVASVQEMMGQTPAVDR